MSILPPRLSAVIPTHDTRELTLRCVESLAAQELEDLQIVVVDDGSEDGTAEALAVAQPRVEILRLEPPGGFTRAANLGLSRSGGDVLLLLNSDTEVQPGALAALLQAFARDDRLGAAGAVLHYPDGSPQWSGGREPDLLWFFGLASGLPSLLGRLRSYRKLKPVGAGPGEVAWVTGAALATRRSAWQEAAPLDEGYRFYGQDLDLCLRLRDMGWKVELVPGFRVLHHHGATIGAREESGGRQHAELLWTDLLHWARKHRGDRWTGRAALALRAGAALRLAARGLAYPLLPAGRKPRWSAESRAFVRAARAVASAQRQALNPE